MTEYFLPQVTFTINADAGSAEFDKQELVFPSSIANQSVYTEKIILTNNGEVTLNGSLACEGSNAYTADVTSIENLKPGESVEINVTFEPTESGVNNGTLVADLGEAGRYGLPLRGESVLIPDGELTTFNGGDYTTSLPRGWKALQVNFSENGEVVGSTTGYPSDFLEGARFDQIDYPQIRSCIPYAPF